MNNDLEQFSEERLVKLHKEVVDYLLNTEGSTAVLSGGEALSLIRIALAAKQAKPVVNIESLATAIMKTIDAETDRFHSLYTLSELRIAIVKTLSTITTPPAKSPAIPDGWVKCSERMPDVKTGVLVGCWFGRSWASKWATLVPGSPESQSSGWIIPGASWNPTHWMPLPAAPKPEGE